MRDDHFADTVCSARVWILRLALLKYSLGHEAILLSRRNPLLIQTSEEFSALPMEQQIFAVKSAVLICSKTWRQNQKSEKWVRLWGWLTRKEDYALAIAEFQNYLSAGRVLPRPPTKHACQVLYGNEEDNGRVLGSPLLAQLYDFACENLDKCSVSEPWDAPYALTGMLYFTSLELKGAARVENSAELDERLNYEKIVAEVAADEAAGKIPKVAAGLATPPPDLGE